MSWTNDNSPRWVIDNRKFEELERVGDKDSEVWLGKSCFDHVTTFAVLFQLSTPGREIYNSSITRR